MLEDELFNEHIFSEWKDQRTNVRTSECVHFVDCFGDDSGWGVVVVVVLVLVLDCCFCHSEDTWFSFSHFGSRSLDKWYVILRCVSDFWGSSLTVVPMLEVLFAVTGESVAVFEDDELADASVKGLKRLLGPKFGVSRFRLRLLQDNCPLDDNQTLIFHDQNPQVVQLVILEFLPLDREQDEGIIAACAANDDKLLEQHLNQPRNPNFEVNAETPLYAAAFAGSLKCVSLLLEAGAQKDKGRTDVGATPLLAAARNGHLEAVRFLVASGANKDQRTQNGVTPLIIAAQSGHLEVVRFLVASGANKDQGTQNGETPLFRAAGQFEIVRFLVASGANKDQGTTDTGATPLFQAAQNGYLEVVRFLVLSGANKDQGTQNGATPLIIAAQNGHLEVVRFLVASGANKDQGTQNGATPLFAAAHNGHLNWSCPISGCLRCQ